MNDLYRYIRQVQVFGECHQRTLATSRAAVPGDGIGPLVEALYLAGAGVGTIEVESQAVAGAARAINAAVSVSVTERINAGAEGPEFADELAGFTDETAKRVARAALAALGRLTPRSPAARTEGT